jgi:hypothetical protein
LVLEGETSRELQKRSTVSNFSVGKKKSCAVEFEDGFRMITSISGLRKRKANQNGKEE